MADTLSEYRRKRDFGRTAEPEGKGGRPGTRARFVIQEHHASRLHWDFRLEVDGVLKSWAVPKGPSTDPREKRLAVPTEDHPLDYVDFEGVIPEDQYGGGAVIVWDAGTYRTLKEGDDGEPVPMADQIRAGHTTFWLEGEKLRGGWALTRIAPRDAGGEQDERWLLVKMDDDEADARRRPTSTQRESVKTGRTAEEVEEEER